jgi:hypothetical protein
MLEQHPKLAYLNEPRSIWLYQPRTDIWSDKARLRKGQLRLTASDVTATAASRVPLAFAVEVRLQNAQRLVEKLPVNGFRIGFITQLFPDALFVHLVRNGIEVAHSIAQFAEVTPKSGHMGYKWQLLTEYARERGEDRLIDLCTNNFLRGLLQWRLSISSALQELSSLHDDRKLEIRYEKLLQDPLGVCDLLESFIGVEPDIRMRQFAVNHIARKSPQGDTASLTPAMRLIAGDLLAQLGY